MLIPIKTDVQVRVPGQNGKDIFVTIPKDSKVNYSWTRKGPHSIHKFTTYSHSAKSIVEYTCVTVGSENPPWL